MKLFYFVVEFLNPYITQSFGRSRHHEKIRRMLQFLPLLGSVLLLSACDSGKENKATKPADDGASEVAVINPDVLPYLNIQEQAAKNCQTVL